MDVDQMLRQMRELRFPSAWDGCRVWADGLVSWHLSQRPTSWASVDETELFIQYTGSVVACALHATAVEQGFDADDGSRLLGVPLDQAAAHLADEPLTVLRAAAPADPELSSLLHSIPHWIEEMGEGPRSQGEFVIEQARAVLVLHAEYGYAVGDRLRAVLDANQALDEVIVGSPDNPADPQLHVYDRAQDIELHQMAINNLNAMCLADERTGQVTFASRKRLLEQAAFNDRIVLSLGKWASDDQRDLVVRGAQHLLDWDRDHSSHTGPLPASDNTWTNDPLGYLRQEYTAHLDRLSEPLL